MRTSVTLGLVALASAILLATTVSTASAGRLRTSEQQFFTGWTSLEFVSTVTIRCEVILHGSLQSSTIAKVARSLIGAITRVGVFHPCTNGEVWSDDGLESQPLGTAPQKLPFHLTYERFTGTLPNISSIVILLSRFSFVIQATVLGLTCRGRYGNVTDNISLTASREGGGAITSITPVEGSNTANLVEQLGGSAVCPGTGRLRGSSSGLVPIVRGLRVSITLI